MFSYYKPGPIVLFSLMTGIPYDSGGSPASTSGIWVILFLLLFLILAGAFIFVVRALYQTEKRMKIMQWQIQHVAKRTTSIRHGEDGQDGRDGIDGAHGRDGINGTNGADGASATGQSAIFQKPAGASQLIIANTTGVVLFPTVQPPSVNNAITMSVLGDQWTFLSTGPHWVTFIIAEVSSISNINTLRIGLITNNTQSVDVFYEERLSPPAVPTGFTTFYYAMTALVYVTSITDNYSIQWGNASAENVILNALDTGCRLYIGRI